MRWGGGGWDVGSWALTELCGENFFGRRAVGRAVLMGRGEREAWRIVEIPGGMVGMTSV